jgi:4a-hydroxytetrahydrobiopterin dehydratase
MREVPMDTLNQEQIAAALSDLGDWGYEGDAFTRTFRFADFVHAIGFVEHLAEVAEERQHHPDIDIRYNKVTLRLSTHSAGGVTARDVELAKAADHLV